MSTSSNRPVFEFRRLPEKTNEALLAELRRVAALIPGEALTVTVFMKLGRVSRRVYNDRFGSWSEALAAAGLSEQSTDKLVTRGAHPSRKMSDEDILQALRNLAKRLNVSELTTAHVNQHLPFSGYTLRTRWNTTQAAFQAAGLSTSLLGRRYTDEECYQNLLAVWTYYGRPPKYLEMSIPPSLVGGKAYTLRFGTWNKALAAFVERVDAELAPAEPPPGQHGVKDHTAIQADRSVKKTEDFREVSLGLRFRILYRDHFKCVICGDHPAANQACKLHVDHILPWSKGGKTREDNLRTLCENCNLGRGNRYMD